MTQRRVASVIWAELFEVDHIRDSPEPGRVRPSGPSLVGSAAFRRVVHYDEPRPTKQRPDNVPKGTDLCLDLLLVVLPIFRRERAAPNQGTAVRRLRCTQGPRRGGPAICEQFVADDQKAIDKGGRDPHAACEEADRLRATSAGGSEVPVIYRRHPIDCASPARKRSDPIPAHGQPGQRSHRQTVSG